MHLEHAVFQASPSVTTFRSGFMYLMTSQKLQLRLLQGRFHSQSRSHILARRCPLCINFIELFEVIKHWVLSRLIHCDYLSSVNYLKSDYLKSVKKTDCKKVLSLLIMVTKQFSKYVLLGALLLCWRTQKHCHNLKTSSAKHNVTV